MFTLASRALLLAASPIAASLAQTGIPPAAYAAMRWRMIGPFRGGRVLAVAGTPANATTFFFGAVDGGVWKTVNAGMTWRPVFDAQPISSIGALAIASSNPDVMYVGTGEADMRSDITYGAGVYKSTDGGEHWKHLGGLDDTRQIGKILVDPHAPDIVFVAALGHAYAPNAERGVYRSLDGGASWTRVLHKSADVGAIDLAFDPGDSRVVFAALWNARRPPWSQYAPNEAEGSGIYKSLDGGTTWTELAGHGLPSGPVGRMGLAVARTPQGTRVYALITAQQGDGAGLYRSENGGASWQRVSTDARISGRGWYFGQVFVDPRNANVVYVPNVSLLRSMDGGRTFVSIKGAPGGDDYHDLWIDPHNASHLIFGSDQGAGVSLDGGTTWSSWYNQPTAQFYHVAVDNQFPYSVYGAQQDAGTVGTASRGNDGSITFRDWHPVGAGEAGYIAPDPLNPNIVYGGDTYGQAFRYDKATGQSHIITPWPISAFGVPMPERKLRFTWTSPIVFDPVDKKTIYMGSNVVLRTRDGGLRWDSISPDLTGMRADARNASGPLTPANAIERGWGVIYTIAPSPLKAGVLWAGTDGGSIHLTTDGGQHWTNVTPLGIDPWSKVAMIEASPSDTATAYAAIDRHRLDDIAPYIYRTRDGGQHWTRVVRGIPTGAYAQVVRADPTRRGLLYAGTELGAYVSFDDGDHWQTLGLNMPIVSVRDLVVHDNDLVAATHGRSFWILDDLNPLRQLSDTIVRSRVHLFTPERAIRVRRSTGTDTPLPPEEPQGENPPAGAVIDYFLGSVPDVPVVLEITDDSGSVIRRFSSTDQVAPPPPPQFPDAWLPRPAIPSRGAGLNRFVWDLRYPSPPTASGDYSIAAIAGKGTVRQPEGSLVLPGTYHVRLTVGDVTDTQPLVVEMDPRVHVSRVELAGQLALALEIAHAMSDEHALHDSATSVRGRIRNANAQRLDAPTRAALMALGSALDTLIAGTTGAEFGDLETAVMSADREPTQPSRDAFAEVRARLLTLRGRWNELVAKQLPALDAALRKP